MASDLGKRLSGTTGLHDNDLRCRTVAILQGQGSTEDFRSLFLGLRFRTRGRRTFRDVADFIAHRDGRDRGAVADLVRDIHAGARVFIMAAVGELPDLDVISAAATANLRIATDSAIAAGCVMSRRAAQVAINRATSALRHRLMPSDRDAFVFNYFGNRLKWHPAFHDHEVLNEFCAVLVDNKFLDPEEAAAMELQGEWLALNVLALLHGAEIELPSKQRVVLQAGFFNKERRLEVKAHLAFNDLGKPIYMPLCVFLTSMQPEGYCDAALLASDPHGWDTPIKVSASGRLCTVGITEV